MKADWKVLHWMPIQPLNLFVATRKGLRRDLTQRKYEHYFYKEAWEELDRLIEAA